MAKPPAPDCDAPAGLDFDDAWVLDVRLADIAEDDTYRFRAVLRVDALATSMEQDGVAVPVLVRRHGAGYQLISGFRRVAAARELGWETLPAVALDRVDHRRAFDAAVLENTRRRTYSDIDRAHVIRRAEAEGRGRAEAATLLGLTKRQVMKLRNLLDLPEELQALLEGGDDAFKTTHALTLLKAARDHDADLDFTHYAAQVRDERLSAADLQLRLQRDLRPAEPPKRTSVLRDDETDWERGSIWFTPVKLEIQELDDEEKTALRSQLQRILDLLA